jgi:hypothetical protein
MLSNFKRLEALEKSLRTRIPVVEIIFMNQGDDEIAVLADAKLNYPNADEFFLVVFVD